jgi:sulfur carrier protein
MREDESTIQITVNGVRQEVARGTTVRGVLDLLGIRGAAAVERNLEIVPRATHATTALGDGDALEVVQLVGGG